MAVRLYGFVFAAAFAVFVESRGINECDLSSAYQPSKACGEDILWFGLNNTQIQEILNVHASDGEILLWSNALADRAQAYVNQCGNESNACFEYDGSKVSIGGEDSESAVSLTDMINSIYARQDFGTSDINIPDTELTDLDFSGLNMEGIELSEMDLPANDMPGDDLSDIYFFRKRRSLEDNNGTVGCGFIMYKTKGGISKYLACFYGDDDEQAWE